MGCVATSMNVVASGLIALVLYTHVWPELSMQGLSSWSQTFEEWQKHFLYVGISCFFLSFFANCVADSCAKQAAEVQDSETWRCDLAVVCSRIGTVGYLVAVVLILMVIGTKMFPNSEKNHVQDWILFLVVPALGILLVLPVAPSCKRQQPVTETL